MIRSILSALLLSGIAWAGISWRGDYDQALKEARSEGKGLMLLLVRRDCSQCKELVRKIGKDGRLSSRIMRSYVPVIVTVGARTAYPIELYYTTTFPALFLVDTSTELPRYGGCRGGGCLSFLRKHFDMEAKGRERNVTVGRRTR